jgi:prepilin-type N-terminal cleavage/methylation domain-containing protein
MRHSSRILRCGPRDAGFSLFEIVAVLMVAAVLSAALAPLLLRETDRLARERELGLLRELDSGLEHTITRRGQIPGPTNWGPTLAATMGLLASEVTTNPRGNERGVLIDPRFGVGPEGTNQPPYTQTALGSLPPVRPRLLLISSLGPALPAELLSGSSLTASAYDELWDLPDKAIPAGWNWPGSGEDLLVHRIDLRSLFQPVILNDLSEFQGQFSVNGSSNQPLPSVPFFTHLLAGSVLGLHGSDGAVQAREVVKYPASYSFEAGNWRGQMLLAVSEKILVGPDLQAAATAFISAPGRGNLTGAHVYFAMTNWLGRYNDWVAAGSTDFGPTWANLRSAYLEMANHTVNLVKAGVK